MAPILPFLLAALASRLADSLALGLLNVDRPWHRYFLEPVTAYKVGQQVEFRAASTQWLNSTVVALGNKPDTYWIHVEAFPESSREFVVHGNVLRDPVKEAELRAARQEAQRQLDAEKDRREDEENHQFKENEEVFMRGSGPTEGRWFRSRIVTAGSKPGTWDVRFNQMVFHNVQKYYLIKTQLPEHYDVCEPVEVMTGSGENATWTRSKVLGPGSAMGLVNIRYPGSLRTILRDIPLVALRKYKANTSNTTAANVEAVQTQANYNASSQPSAVFEVGQEAWVKLDGPTQPWARCTITALGEWPETFTIRIGEHVPEEVICDVPSFMLRETEETAAARAHKEAERQAKEEAAQAAVEEAVARQLEESEREKAEAAAKEAQQQLLDQEAERARIKEEALNKIHAVAAYAVDQLLQFNTQGSTWVGCRVLSLGHKPNMYNIFVPSFPKGLQEVEEVPEQALRSSEDVKQQQFEAEQAKQKDDEARLAKQLRAHTFEPNEHVQVMEKGTWVNATIKGLSAKRNWYLVDINGVTTNLHSSSLRRDPEHEFEDGEAAMYLMQDDSWLPCTISRPGEVVSTYNIFFPKGSPGHRNIHNVPVERLRRMKYVAKQPVQVLIKKGPSADLWLEAEVIEPVPNTKDVYKVHVFDSLQDFNISRIPHFLMRISEAGAAKLREKWKQQREAREEQKRRQDMLVELETQWLQNHTFKVGESVQVKSAGKDAGTWVNMTVMSNGTLPGTYNIMWTRKQRVFHDVKRRNIRKDPESQARKIQEAEEGKQLLEEQEAKRRKLAQERTRRAEEEAREEEAENKRKQVAPSSQEALILGEPEPVEDQDDVPSVSAELLEKIIEDTKTELKKEEERLKRVGHVVATNGEREQAPQNDEDELAARQREWDEALKESEEEEKSEAIKPSASESAPNQEQPRKGEEEEEKNWAAEPSASETATDQEQPSSEEDEELARRQSEWDTAVRESEEEEQSLAAQQLSEEGVATAQSETQLQEAAKPLSEGGASPEQTQTEEQEEEEGGPAAEESSEGGADKGEQPQEEQEEEEEEENSADKQPSEEVPTDS